MGSILTGVERWLPWGGAGERRKPGVSERVRRYLGVTLLGALVTVVFLTLVYRNAAVRDLEEVGRSDNLALAQGLSRSLGPTLRELLHPQAGLLPETLRARPEVQALRGHLLEHFQGLPIVKVKVYTPSGLTVFSTDLAQIGEDQSGNAGVQAALAGSVATSLVHRNEFNAFDRVMQQRDLLQSYMAIEDPASGEVAGVFELYTDVTELLQRLVERQRNVTAGVLVIMGFFTFVLLVIFLQTERSLQAEEAARARYVAELEGAKGALETRVAERTRDLEASRQFLQSVIDAIGDPIVVLELDYRIRSMNRAARGQMPLAADAPAPELCFALGHRLANPCTGDDHPCPAEEVLRTGGAVTVTHRHIGTRGETRFVDVTAAPLRDGGGKTVGLVEVNHDVTDHVYAVEALRHSEQRFRDVATTAGEYIWELDRDGRYSFLTERVSAVLGFEPAELIGRRPLDLMPADEVQRVQQTFDRFPPDEPFHHFEHRSYTRSGEVVWQRVSGVPVLDAQGDIVGFRGAAENVTQRKNAEAELEAARARSAHQEKMAAIGRLAAGIIHEVGNPIAAIAGAVHELSEHQRGTPCPVVQCPVYDDAEGHLRVISEQVERLTGITREIADFASPREGERQLTDLNGLVRSVATLLRYDQRFRRIVLEFDLDPGLPAVPAVADQLFQVFMNLFINAADACEGLVGRRARVQIATRVEGARVCIAVTDNGRGMSPEVRDQALDAFFTTKPTGRGTGLGLALCQSIVTAHFGEIRIESEPDQGTRVEVLLPVAELDGSAEVGAPRGYRA